MTTDTYVSDSERVLAVLKAATGEWVADLYGKTHVMVHSRVSNLRDQGWVIECKCFAAGDYRYRLLGRESTVHV